MRNSYDDIEFDITITNDGQIVVFHDDDLKRLCGTLAFIEEVSYSFLEKQKLYETDEKIPFVWWGIRTCSRKNWLNNRDKKT